MNHLTSPDHVAWPVEVALEVSDPQVYSNEAEWDVKKHGVLDCHQLPAPLV